MTNRVAFCGLYTPKLLYFQQNYMKSAYTFVPEISMQKHYFQHKVHLYTKCNKAPCTNLSSMSVKTYSWYIPRVVDFLAIALLCNSSFNCL